MQSFLLPQNFKFLNTFLVFLIIHIRFDLSRSGDSNSTNTLLDYFEKLLCSEATEDHLDHVDEDEEWGEEPKIDIEELENAIKKLKWGKREDTTK